MDDNTTSGGSDDNSLVVCFGEMLIDFVPTVGGVSLAEAPAFKKAPGGAPANVAVGISRLGGTSAFIGKVVYPEVLRLRAKYESLLRSQRNFIGEDLGPLTAKELQKIEKQLERTLSRARQRKTELMLQDLEKLQKKAHDLGEENERLKSKLEEVKHLQAAAQESGGPSVVAVNHNLLRVHPSQSIHNVQLGYHQYVPQNRINEARTSVMGSINQGWI